MAEGAGIIDSRDMAMLWRASVKSGKIAKWLLLDAVEVAIKGLVCSKVNEAPFPAIVIFTAALVGRLSPPATAMVSDVE